ncbi:hypothetical protein [uncultured Alistipes sp.]|uniref:DUF6712 family protein n=1 Tax=uncultured Alistipes sp. TaxID=538949 RepID=UPI0026159B0F|nr:hypothetical protein [uncultured Alistipes sp.]
MNTLITPLQVLKLAFGNGENLPPDAFGEADIAAAEQRHIIPVIGQELYEKILSGTHAEFRDEYLAPPAALFTRLALQPRLDIRTGQCGTSAPKSSWGQPADKEALRRQCRALRSEARTLLRRAVAYLDSHRREFPEYLPEKNILNRCTTDGGFVQIR